MTPQKDPEAGFRRYPRRSTVKPDQALAAIIECKGILADAAKMLGMSRTNLVRMCQNSSKLARELKNQRDSLLDFTEKKMWQKVSEGSERCIIYTLSTLGKSRGWVLPKGTDLNVGDTPTMIVQNVTINAVPSGEFVGDDDKEANRAPAYRLPPRLDRRPRSLWLGPRRPACRCPGVRESRGEGSISSRASPKLKQARAATPWTGGLSSRRP